MSERFDDALVEKVARAIAGSMWGEAQAKSFFEIKTANVHYGMAMNAARDALSASAIEARQRQDRADGPDPKGESAAPKEDAHISIPIARGP